MGKDVKIYPHIYPRFEDWPVYQLSRDRAQFIQDIDALTFEKLSRKDLSELIAKTLYLERIRLKEDPWKVDPPNEKAFWNKIGKRLIKRSLDKEPEEARKAAEEILAKIIHRYSEEIVGTFSVSHFRFARRFLTAFFNRLFNAAVRRNFLRGLFRGRRNLYEQFNVRGDVERVRALFERGAVVVVPTHFSNLDSILVGYVMDQIMGLPAFAYGAGLNLYNFGPAAYFMNRLGAYRVDRRKKNPIYLETLKSMSMLSIRRGVNNLFFPGGTRSRSGALESDLKMGLLGTAVEAQRVMCQQGERRKVFIVPMVIGYHFVLEAPFLIEQHLRAIGKEQYLRLKDEGQTVRGWLRFIWRFLSTTSDITISVGRPMDVLGNFVDSDGVSRNAFGQELDIADYFRHNHAINADAQREAEYTRLLASRILDRYFAENVVLSSHLAAFVVFELLVQANPRLDIFGVLRLPPDEYVFPFAVVEEAVAKLLEALREMRDQERIQLCDSLENPIADVVREGIRKLGAFHAEPPLKFNKKGDILSSNFRLLYYYHNRLTGYGLEKRMPQVADAGGFEQMLREG